MLTLLIIVTIVGMMLGIPFAFALLLGITTATLLFEPDQFNNLLAQALGNITDPLLISIPILIIAGEMLSAVGAIEPIVDFADRLLGRIPGSLGLVTVVTSMFFAGSTGSSAAEAAAVAAAFKRPMAQRGYPTRYVAPLVAASTAVGVLFPPSLAMVLYATIVQYPVTELWKAGLLPGIMTGVLIAVVAVLLGRRAVARAFDRPGRNGRAGMKIAPAVTGQNELIAAGSVERPANAAHALGDAGSGSADAASGAVVKSGAGVPAVPDANVPSTTTASRDGRRSTVIGSRTVGMSRARELAATFGGILLPVFVIYGIYSGLLTLTEVAAVLVALVILYGLFLTRVGAKELIRSARRGAERAGAVFIIIVAARLFSTILTEQQVLPKLITWVSGLGLSLDLLLLAINVALIVAGIFMDALSLIIIGAPILYALLIPMGVSPVHLAIIMAMNIEIGVVHPPFGGNLFAVSAVTGEKVGRIAIGVLPYIGILLFMLALVTFVPMPGFAWVK